MAKETEIKKKKGNSTNKSATNKKGTTSKKSTSVKNISAKKTDTVASTTEKELKKEVSKAEMSQTEIKSEKEIVKEVNTVNKTPMKKLPTEEGKVIKRFIIVLLVVIISVAAIYFVTRIFVTKDLFNKDNNSDTQEITFNYDKTILGSVFNRPYDEYFVIVYKSSDEQASYLSTLIKDYNAKDEHLKIYFADLDDYMNSAFYDKDNINKNATKASDLKVGDYTLIKINDKKIVKYIEGVDDIASELK